MTLFCQVPIDDGQTRESTSETGPATDRQGGEVTPGIDDPPGKMK